jgi:hypothetical protein
MFRALLYPSHATSVLKPYVERSIAHRGASFLKCMMMVRTVLQTSVVVLSVLSDAVKEALALLVKVPRKRQADARKIPQLDLHMKLLLAKPQVFFNYIMAPNRGRNRARDFDGLFDSAPLGKSCLFIPKVHN